MPKRSSRERDPNTLAYQIVKQATHQNPLKEKNPHAVMLGRLGGLKGGRARAERLTQKQRKKIARKAAFSRWNKPR